MAIYSKQFAQQRLTTFGASVVYTVPAGKVAVLRDLVLVSRFSGSQTVAIWVESGSGVQVYLLHRVMAQWDDIHWTGRQVLPTGYKLTAYTNGSDLDISASGYELT